jgi:hypothetical protein
MTKLLPCLSALLLLVPSVRAADAAPARGPAVPATTAAAPARGPAAPAIPPAVAPGEQPVPLEAGYVALFDGKSFEGWKMAEEHQETWKVEDGAIVAHGDRSHLFYIGDGKPFKNFDLRVEVMTMPGSNGGIYFHTKYQATGWPIGGFEFQVNNTHTDWKKTGSIYDVVNVAQSPAQDGKWWTQEVTVRGSKVTVTIDGKRIIEYTELPGVTAGKDFERKLGEGTFALQGHDPNSVVRYRNIRVLRLP